MIVNRVRVRRDTLGLKKTDHLNEWQAHLKHWQSSRTNLLSLPGGLRGPLVPDLATYSLQVPLLSLSERVVVGEGDSLLLAQSLLLLGEDERRVLAGAVSGYKYTMNGNFKDESPTSPLLPLELPTGGHSY